MISWSFAPLLFTSILGSYWLGKLSYQNRDGMYALLALALVAMAAHACGELIIAATVLLGLDWSLNLIHEWTRVIAISFTLSGMGMLIRNSKPAFARFPRVFTGIPILIVATYPFAMDTLVLKDWLMGIYEGGALIIAILMYSVLTVYENRFASIIPAVMVFMGEFLCYWFVPSSEMWPEWIWYSWLSIGILAFTYGYRYLDRQGLKPYKSNGVTGQIHQAGIEDNLNFQN